MDQQWIILIVILALVTLVAIGLGYLDFSNSSQPAPGGDERSYHWSRHFQWHDRA